jgi:hypothetical protein
MAQVIPVALASDVRLARRAAKAMALAIGFDAKVSEEIALVISEPASNLVRHTQGGQLTLTVGRNCRATRGVVMALVRFDFAGDDIRFSFASVGNIETRVFGGANGQQFIVPRGIVSGNAPHPRVTDHRWDPGTVMVLHSDGVTARWGWADFPGLTRELATPMAQRLLRTLAKRQ